MSETESLGVEIVGACAVAETDEYGRSLQPREIKRNMLSLVLLETTFWTGSADINLALQPLLVFLGASNAMIGAVNGAVWIGLIGVLLSPWITKRFRYKKWYLFMGNVPYLTALFIMGLMAIYADTLGLSRQSLLLWVFGLYLAHWFFGGFVTLPCTEYIAACIPMSHRGRLTGYAYSAAGGTAIGAALAGQWILKNLEKPASFGYVLLLGWMFMQLGYTCMLFAKERPTPVEKSPEPYKKEMFSAFFDDKPYANLIFLYFLYTSLFYLTTFSFVQTYGFKVLKMPLWTSATMIIVQQISKLLTSAPMGLFIDRLTPKKTIPWIFLASAAAWSAPMVMPHVISQPLSHYGWAKSLIAQSPVWAYLIPAVSPEVLGVYISLALSTIFVTAIISAQTALICGLPSPEHRAGHFTIQIILMYIALSVGPMLIGWLCDIMPFTWVFAMLAVVSLFFTPLSRHMLRLMPDDLKAYN